MGLYRAPGYMEKADTNPCRIPLADEVPKAAGWFAPGCCKNTSSTAVPDYRLTV